MPQDTIKTPPENSSGNIEDLLQSTQSSFGDASYSQSGGKVITDNDKAEMDSYDFDEIERFEAYQNNNNLNDMLNERQDGFDKVGRALWTGVAGGVNTAIAGTADLINPKAWVEMMELTEGQMAGIDGFKTGNGILWSDSLEGLSKWAEENKEQIYDRNRIHSDGIGDLGWFAKGFQGLAESYIGFMVPGGIAGKIAGRSLQLLKARGLAADIGANIATAFMMNSVETATMRRQLEDNVRKSAIDSGMTLEEAEAQAKKSGDDFGWANKMSMITGFVGLRGVTGSGMFGGAKKSLANKAALWGKESASEGIEELWGDGAQGYYENKAMKEMGLKPEDNKGIVKHLYDYTFSKEGFETFAWGAAGGPFQQFGRSAFQKGLTKWSGGSELNQYQHPGDFEDITIEKPKTNLPPKREYDTQTIVDDSGNEKIVLIEGNKETVLTPEQFEAKQEKDDAKWEEENSELITEWEEYDNSVRENDKAKKEHTKQVAEWSRLTNALAISKLTGTKGQAVKDVRDYLKGEAKLEQDWLKAQEDGDEVAIREIEDRKLENLFIKYANQGFNGDPTGSTELLIEHFEAMAKDGNEVATRALAKIGDSKKGWVKEYDDLFKKFYRTEDRNVAKKMANDVFKTKAQLSSNEVLLVDIDSKVSAAQSALVAEASKLHPGKSITAVANIKAKEVELKAIESLLAVTPDKAVASQLRKKANSLKSSIKEDNESLKDEDQIKDSELNPELVDKLRKLSVQKATTQTAVYQLRDNYDNYQKPDYFKNRRERSLERLKRAADLSQDPAHIESLREAVFLNDDYGLSRQERNDLLGHLRRRQESAEKYRNLKQSKSEEYQKRVQQINHRKKAIRDELKGLRLSQAELDTKEGIAEAKTVLVQMNDSSIDPKRISHKKKEIKSLEDELESLEKNRDRNSAISQKGIAYKESLEKQLNDLNDELKTLTQTSLNPFFDQIKNNPAAKRAITKLMLGDSRLTVKELESLADLKGLDSAALQKIKL